MLNRPSNIFTGIPAVLAAISKTFTNLIRPSEQLETGESRGLGRTFSRGGLVSTAYWQNEHYQGDYIPPVRDPVRARRLIAVCNVPEAEATIDRFVTDVFASFDGDDIGFQIAEEQEDGSTVDPRLREIGNNLIKRCLGLETVESIVKEFLCYGDSFRSIMLDEKFTRVVRLKNLPVWELFRIEDHNESILRFEQRRFQGQFQGQSTEDGVLTIHPAICIHWRFKRQRLYGQSLFETAGSTADSLDRGYLSLDKAAIAVGTNPNLHEMPEGWSIEQVQAYKRNYEAELQQGKVITDHYTYNQGDVRKVSNQWPDLSALSDSVINSLRKRMAMIGQVPPWMLGIEQTGAKDLAGGPMLAYIRLVSRIRQTLTIGLKQAIDLELILNGYTTPESRQYRLVYPRLHASTIMQDVQTKNEGEEAEGGGKESRNEELDADIARFRSYLDGHQNHNHQKTIRNNGNVYQ